MNMDTKAKLIVAGAALATASAIATANAVRKHRLKKPLPGTTKIEKIYIIKTPIKK